MQAIVCSNTTRMGFEPTYKEAKFFNSRELFRRD